MSHNVETMAYSGETPWHGLGVPVSNDMTPTEIMRAAGVDWEVFKAPLFAKWGNQEVQIKEGLTQALIRSTDNRVLSSVSDEWIVNQNQKAFDFFYEFVLAGQMQMRTAGSLKDGKLVWVLAEITSDEFEVIKGDNIKPYLLFTNPHEYGKSIDIRYTAVRVVCMNTLVQALGDRHGTNVKLTHRAEMDEEFVKRVLGLAHTRNRKYKGMAEFLSRRHYDSHTIVEYMRNVFPQTAKQEEKDDTKLRRTAQMCLDVVDLQPGSDFGRGTWWQAYNAVTYMIDHKLGRTDETRLYNSWYGPMQSLKEKALQKALDMAEDSEIAA